MALVVDLVAIVTLAAVSTLVVMGIISAGLGLLAVLAIPVGSLGARAGLVGLVEDLLGDIALAALGALIVVGVIAAVLGLGLALLGVRVVDLGLVVAHT